MSHAGLPRWLWLPATCGAAIVIVPIIGLLTQVPYASLWDLISSDSALNALRLSLQTSLAATGLCVIGGVPLAFVLARTRFPGRRVLRSVGLLPLVLPPVVGGIALLYTFGRMGLIGRYLEAGGISIAFTAIAVVLAQTFVSLPFMVMTLEGALRSTDPRYERIAAGLGASPTRTLLTVTIPVLAPALASGTVLCFARALGEFGATLTFAGSLQGRTRTMPLEIYLARETDPAQAIALSVVLMVIAFTIVAATYRTPKQARA